MSSGRQAAVDRLSQALRVASAQGLLVSQVVAARVGLNSTDMECLDVIETRGSMSAGDLHRQTGLTTGAITAVLDRLENAGYIRRQPDPADRRRVLIAVRADKMKALRKIYAPLRTAMEKLYEDYPAATLLAFAEFTERGTQVSAQFVSDIEGE